MKKSHIFVLSTLALLGAIQFIPYGKNHINPPVLTIPTWDSPKTKELFYRACADCHSNETKYPWYSNIAPVSWLVQHDIDEGREHFNISMIGKQQKNELNEAGEEIQKGSMPMAIYLPTHPEARLTPEEKKLLISGLNKMFGEKAED